MDRCSKHRGFTLIELVTVVVIVGVIGVGIAGPTLASFGTLRSRLAANTITSDLTFIQRYALNYRVRTWAIFDVSGNRYRLVVEDSSGSRSALVHPMRGTGGYLVFGSGQYGGVALVSVNVNGSSDICFDSAGRPGDTIGSSLTADALITLNNGVTITVRRVSGLAEQQG